MIGMAALRVQKWVVRKYKTGLLWHTHPHSQD